MRSASLRGPLANSLAAIGVASAVVASPFARAQVPKVVVPRPSEVMKREALEKKVLAVPFPDTVVLQKRAVRILRPAGEVEVIAGAPQLDALMEQFTPQFRPILRAEYHLARSVCELTAAERTEIAREGEKALGEAAKAYAEMQQKMMRGQWRANEAPPDPATMIEEGLARAIRARLPADRAARYESELAKRENDRKCAAVRNLVAKLDQELVLSADQREKISAEMTANWADSWGRNIEPYLNNANYFPAIPRRLLIPYLNSTQRSVWSAVQQVSTTSWRNAALGAAMTAGDDPLEDEELVEARKAAGGRKERK
jgi:hypothetical protein